MGLVSRLLGGWQGYAAIAGLCLLAGSIGTWRVMSWKEAAGQTKQAEQTVRLVEHQAQITFNVSATYEAIKDDDAANTIKLLREIPVHVTPKDDAACTVPLGFVRVFNAATHGPVPDAASGPDEAASGTPLSTVAQTDTINAGQYDEISHQLTAIQEWIRQQQEASQK